MSSNLPLGVRSLTIAVVEKDVKHMTAFHFHIIHRQGRIMLHKVLSSPSRLYVKGPGPLFRGHFPERRKNEDFLIV